MIWKHLYYLNKWKFGNLFHKLDDIKILGGIYFYNFISILDNFEGDDSNNNNAINNAPGISIMFVMMI